MAAPVGSLVKLYIDTRLPDIERGDAIETGTGRRYLIETARLQTRGRHAGTRWHITALVLGDHSPLPGDVRIIPIRWYRR